MKILNTSDITEYIDNCLKAKFENDPSLNPLENSMAEGYVIGKINFATNNIDNFDGNDISINDELIAKVFIIREKISADIKSNRSSIGRLDALESNLRDEEYFFKRGEHNGYIDAAIIYLTLFENKNSELAKELVLSKEANL